MGKTTGGGAAGRVSRSARTGIWRSSDNKGFRTKKNAVAHERRLERAKRRMGSGTTSQNRPRSRSERPVGSARRARLSKLSDRIGRALYRGNNAQAERLINQYNRLAKLTT